MNGAHARHYVDLARSSHGAIVRLQEERDALAAHVAELEAELAVLRAERGSGGRPGLALVA